MEIEEIINFYSKERNQDRWIESYLFDEEMSERSYNKRSLPYALRELIKISSELADGKSLNNRELAENSSLRFSILLDAFRESKKSVHGKETKRKVTVIIEKYRDRILELSKDRAITKELNSSHKYFLRQLKDELDPNNNISHTNFRDYSNPLAMIAFVNGHTSSNKRLTQRRAKEVLDKVLIEDAPQQQSSKAETVLNFSINNLVEYLSKSSKKRMLRATLRIVSNPKRLFFNFAKKYPDDYIDILFGQDMFIRKFNKFSKEELGILLSGMNKQGFSEMIIREKSIILANRLYLKPNSGGTRVFFEHLDTNKDNGFSPYFSEMAEVIESINHNIKLLLNGLGSKKNEY